MNRSVLSKQINREQIDSLKNDTKALLLFLQDQNDSTIVYVLEKLGRLENEYSKQPLLNLLNNENETIRTLALKNLAKIGDISLLDTFINFAKQDESTEVRRESVSAIGRLRNEKTIPTLIKLLSDRDPKVVMQAIRGLLVFSNNNGKHDEFPAYLKNTIVQGDVVETLKHVPDDSIHLTFTSPPYYNARDYSIYQSYDEYLRFLEEVFKEVHRITKEGRFFVLNTSPIIIPRISRAHASRRYPIPYDIHPLLVKMGWQFIDDIVWVKQEASVKNRNAGFLQHRKPLGYKPNAISEMLMVYRKKTDKLIDWNINQYSWEKVKNSKVFDKYETTNIWHISPSFDRVHSAVFPIELCNRVIKYYSFIDDLIFDPFAGSGTLGLAAINLNRNFFLTEKEPKYINRMKEYLNKDNRLLGLKNNQPNFVDIKNFISRINGKI